MIEKATEEVASEENGSADTGGLGNWISRHRLLVAVTLIGLSFAYVQGVFDKLLVDFGLNAQACGHTIAFGTLCGEELEEFCLQFYEPALNGRVCDEVLYG